MVQIAQLNANSGQQNTGSHNAPPPRLALQELHENRTTSLKSAGNIVENGTVRTTHVLQPRSVGGVYSQVMR